MRPYNVIESVDCPKWSIPLARKQIVNSSMPSGLIYVPDFIDAPQERECLAAIDELPFEPYLFGEYVAKRLVVQFGAEEYRARTYGGNKKLDTMPDWLHQLRQKCANLVGLNVEEVAQSLVARYEDAGIGWHRDAPQFGPTVSVCPWEFQQRCVFVE